jgi:hypothetical protein
MSVNLSEIGGSLLSWLALMEEEKDTSKLQAEVRKSCCEKPLENLTTALGTLVDLSDLLSKNGFLDDSELQIILAQKIDDLATGSLKKAPEQPAQVEQKAERKEKPSAPSGVPTDPIERKIFLIKREQQELSEMQRDAAGLKEDDIEVRELRQQALGQHQEALEKLLAKTLAASKEPLSQSTKKEEAPQSQAPEAGVSTSASATAELPKAPSSASTPAKEAKVEEKAPAIVEQPKAQDAASTPAKEAKVEEKAPATAELPKAPSAASTPAKEAKVEEKAPVQPKDHVTAPAFEADPVLLVEINSLEEEVSLLQGQVAFLGSADGADAEQLKKTLARKQELLAQLLNTLS